jgi:hypothetical protein
MLIGCPIRYFLGGPCGADACLVFLHEMILRLLLPRGGTCGEEMVALLRQVLHTVNPNFHCIRAEFTSAKNSKSSFLCSSNDQTSNPGGLNRKDAMPQKSTDLSSSTDLCRWAISLTTLFFREIRTDALRRR